MFQNDVDYGIDQKVCMAFSHVEPIPDAKYQDKEGNVYQVFNFAYPMGARTKFSTLTGKWIDEKTKKQIESYITPNAQSYKIKEPVVTLKNPATGEPIETVLTGSEWIELGMTLVSLAPPTNIPERVIATQAAQEQFYKGEADEKPSGQSKPVKKARLVPPVE